MTSSNAERAAFLAGEGTLTAEQVRWWACELEPGRPLQPLGEVPLNEPLMVSVIPERDTRGLLGATIIPSVIRRGR